MTDPWLHPLGQGDRFAAGKAIALMKMEIHDASSRITRRFKANQIVDVADVDTIKRHAEAIGKLVEYWNEVRAKELGEVVKKP